jgi:heavy metal sensor kinase
MFLKKNPDRSTQNTAEQKPVKSLPLTFPQAIKNQFKFRSVKFEISVIYTAVLAAVLIIFSGAIYTILSNTLYKELDNEVQAKAQEIANNIASYLEFRGEQPNALNFALEKTITHEDKILRRWWYIGFERTWFRKLDEQDLSKQYINFVSPEGKSLVCSKNVPESLLAIFMQHARAEENTEQFFYVEHEGQKIRIINYPMVNRGQRYILQVGISPKPVVLLLELWMHQVMLVIPIILLLTCSIGYFLASRILNPVEKISKLAKNISHKDLSQRVDTEYFYKEMHSLVIAFNDMITRLEKSFSHIEQFSSHIAHELKTPLTIMRGEAELALMEKRSGAEYEQGFQIILTETEGMFRTIEDMLLLAKLDHQPGHLKFEPIDFYAYLHEIYEQCRMLAKPKGIGLNFIWEPAHNSFMINGDRLHLRRLFFNVIDNAIKFTPNKGKVTITVQFPSPDLRVIVSDSGTGIPSDQLERVFDRFYRLNNNTNGNGLGLSIVQAIAKIHQIAVGVESTVGQGTMFYLDIPVSHRYANRSIPLGTSV